MELNKASSGGRSRLRVHKVDLVPTRLSARLWLMNLPSDGIIKKRVGRVRPDTPVERLDQLWQMYLLWKSTPAGRQPQPIPPHVRKIVRKAA